MNVVNGMFLPMRTAIAVAVCLALCVCEPSLNAQTYSYDLGGRLTSVVYGGGSEVNYAYDPAANISGISSTSAPNTNSPAVTIVSPTPGSTVYSAILPFSGTATGKNQVILVYYQLNNGPWEPATTSNGWTNWTAFVTLNSGANLFTVYAEDAVGNSGSSSIMVNAVLPLPWSPSQLGTNLSLWLDASSSGSVTVNGANVSQWSDISGRGNNVTNSNVSAQPLYQPTGLNNLPTINFSTSGMWLVGTGTFGVSGNSPRALAAVMNGGLLATGTPANTEAFGFDITAGGNVWAPYFYGTDVYGYAPAFSYHSVVMFGQYSNGVGSGYANGSFFGSTSFTANTVPAPIRLGTRSDGATRTGAFSEIVYVNTALPSAQQQRLEGYLAWKWGLQTNLPASHPYYNIAPAVAPNNALVAIAQATSTIAPRTLSFAWSTIAGVSYQVEYSTNLSSANWINLGNIVVATNNTLSASDVISTNTQRYYRVVLLP
ncbi:MAG: hypothetical protein WCK27_00740 [Verrucomicrobiota bacterium]